MAMRKMEIALAKIPHVLELRNTNIYKFKEKD